MERGWRSGPRLPVPKGPICVSCKGPERKGNKVIVGVWGVIRFHMDLPLCEECVRDLMPRPNPDPLTLEDVA